MRKYTPDQSLSEYPFVLRGDVSGIQDFIFNIKSQGAARALKSRSFFVQAISDLCLKLIEDELGEQNCIEFYNGGGGFYVFCKEIGDEQLERLRGCVQRELSIREIYLSLSVVRRQGDFATTWREVHQAAAQDKQQKYRAYSEAFEPFERGRENDAYWKRFSKKLTQSGELVIGSVTASPVGFSEDAIRLFGQEGRLKGRTPPKNINWHLPKWSEELIKAHSQWINKLRARDEDDDHPREAGDILEFETLGYFAYTRSGTDKIAALKMDVDSLGRLFSEQNDWARTAKLSQALKTFFEERIFDLWKSDFTFHDQTGNEQRTPFSENIYVVFSGGDDCMMVGGWDAVFAFAGKIKEAFDDFWKDKMGELGLKKPPTLSASLTVVDPKFPIARLAALAEEALKEAKQAAQGEKNRIAVFGRILTWDEFFKAQRIAHQLERLIKKENEPRNILQRIRMSQSSFDPILRKALEEGVVENPAIWRIRYYLRRSKNDLEDIVQEYTEAILQAILCRKRTNSDLFPVAARWAELMTRSYD